MTELGPLRALGAISRYRLLECRRDTGLAGDVPIQRTVGMRGTPTMAKWKPRSTLGVCAPGPSPILSGHPAWEAGRVDRCGSTIASSWAKECRFDGTLVRLWVRHHQNDLCRHRQTLGSYDDPETEGGNHGLIFDVGSSRKQWLARSITASTVTIPLLSGGMVGMSSEYFHVLRTVVFIHSLLTE